MNFIILLLLLGISLLVTTESVFAQTANLSITSTEVWGNDNELLIRILGTAPADYFGTVIIYDKNNAIVYQNTFSERPVDTFQIFPGDIKMKTYAREVQEGIGLIEIIPHTKTRDIYGDATPTLIEKIDITRFHLNYLTHKVQIENGKFSPSELTIDFRDSIEIIPDCDDCYKLRYTMTQNQETDNLLKTNFLSSLSPGTYKISDYFEPKDELIIHVRTFEETKTIHNESQSNTNQYTENIGSQEPKQPPTDAKLEGFTPPIESKEVGIASFVDKSKDPQYYIDRYNKEPSYREWFHENYPQYDTIEQAVGVELTEKIPDWVKNIFGWYAADQVSEDELLNAIKYLINEKILVVN